MYAEEQKRKVKNQDVIKRIDNLVDNIVGDLVTYRKDHITNYSRIDEVSKN